MMEVGDPEAVGADHAHAGGPADGEQLVLPRTALRAHLGEPGRQDDERPHALLRALACGLEHRRRGHRDHGELDVAFDVGDRANRGPAGDLSVAQIDEVQRPREASGHQVAHDLATQGSGPARRPDDRDRRGSQDVSDGRDVRDALVILEAPPRIRRQRGRELELDDIVHAGHGHREARIVEHPEHAVVGAHDGRRERRDVLPRGGLGEVCEQHGRDPVPVPRIGDREGDLRAARPPDVGAVADDRVVRASHGEQRQPVRGRGGLVRRPGEVHAPAEEAEPARLLRQRAEERAQPRLVLGRRGPHVDGRAIPEHDVGVGDPPPRR